MEKNLQGSTVLKGRLNLPDSTEEIGWAGPEYAESLGLEKRALSVHLEGRFGKKIIYIYPTIPRSHFEIPLTLLVCFP